MNHDINPRMHRWTLSFQRDLEWLFLENYSMEVLTMSRWAFGLGGLMYIGFCLLDYLMFPSVYKTLWGIRIFWVLPQFIVAFVLTFFVFSRRYLEPIFSIFCLSAAWGIYAMMMLAPAPDSYGYYGGILLLLVYCYTLLRLRFVWAAFVGWSITLSYFLTAIGLMSTPFRIVISSGSFVFSVNLAGMVAAYYIEQYARLSFYRGLLIDEARQDLERKVATRTREIQAVNKSLEKKNNAYLSAVKAAKENEKKYRTLVGQLPDGICIVCRKKIVYYNDMLAKMLGKASHDILNEILCDFLETLPLNHRDKTRINAAINMETRAGPGHPELHAISVGKEMLFFELRNFPTLYNGVAATLCLIRDVSSTEREKRERALLQKRLDKAEKMKAIALLTGGVAHDLNNILSGIVSYPELLLMDLPADSPMKAPLEVILDSGQRAASIVSDLLTVARGVASERNPVNLNEEVAAYLSSPEYNRLMENYDDVSVVSVLDDDKPMINASGIHIRKVIMNLMGNAVEAIDGSGCVEISTFREYLETPVKGYDDVVSGEYLRLRITDDGPGIEEKDLNNIFEPFYTRKKMGRSGTGLGLTVVAHTLRDHDGYILVESSKVGTCFSLWFPATQVEQELLAVDEIPLEVYAGRGERILVVDDEPVQRRIACDILERMGYCAESVSSGEAAIEFVKSEAVDLLVLDMMMEPGMNSLETYSEIVQMHPAAKAIIASGYSAIEQVREAQALGAGDLVKKPYTLEGLVLAVRMELDTVKVTL